ncbi:MAG: hypothetical protein HY435_03230 [Candidatus Liptonbacteria bacterium]|nr:hypothetical protein [Candidatus Liptonbacteria bacterium]
MERDEELDFLRKLYPGLTEDELQAAGDRLDEYLDLALRIYERLRQDPAAYPLLKALLEERRDKGGDSADDG